MPDIRGVATKWVAEGTSASVFLPTTLEAGDQITVLVVSANAVGSFTHLPFGVDVEENLTGSPDGMVLIKPVCDGSEAGAQVRCLFSDSGPHMMAAIVLTGADDHEINAGLNSGSAAGAGSVGWTADGYQGDMLMTLALARGAATPPTMTRGVLWQAEADADGSAALYLESLPAYSAGESFSVDMPARSGHVVLSVPVYGLTVGAWEAGDPFQKVIDPPTIGHKGTYGWSEARIGESPAWVQADFVADTWVDDSTDVHPALWGHDRTLIEPDDTLQRDASVGYLYEFYGRRPTDVDLTEPPDVYPPGTWEVEYADGAPYEGATLLSAEVIARILDLDLDETADPDGPVGSPNFSTVAAAVTGMVYGSPTAEAAGDWVGTGPPAGTLLYIRPAQTAGTDADTIDLTDAIINGDDPRIEWVTYVTGPGGAGTPTIDLASYTSSTGTALFGAEIEFDVVASGGGLTITVQPPDRRYTLRQTPPVIITPPTLVVVRQYPRSDGLGMSSAARRNPAFGVRVYPIAP